MLGLFLARVLPRQWAYGVGEGIVGLLLRQRDSELYQAVRSNQAVVRGRSYEDETLHEAVREVLINSAYGLVDWFRAMADRKAFDNLACSIDDHIFASAYASQASGHGFIYVGAHMSSFNMFFMKMAREGFPIQILSYYQEEGSYRADNIFRRRFNLNVTPISPATLRQAYKRLMRGGFVLTGVDRPDTGGEPFTFFGRTTILPVGHARLALKTGARMLIGAVRKLSTGLYHVQGSDVIVPVSTAKHQDDVRRLTQQILDQLEVFIRERPSEWMMFVPLWPEVIPN